MFNGGSNVQFLALLQSILCLIISSTNFNIPHFTAQIETTSHINDGIFFGIITGDVNSSVHRREFQYSNWIKFLKSYNHGYSYIIEGQPNIPYNYSTIVKKYNIKSDKNSERAAKKLSAAYYFYYETTYSWLWITNDDVSVSITRLNKLVHNLNKKYKTNSQSIVLGECVGHSDPFIQGGSGMILSRAAAYNFTEFGVEWIREKLNNIPDDFAFNQFIKRIGETPSSCNTPAMVGHYFDMKIPLDITKIPKCNGIVNYPETCYKNPQSADEIVAIHHNFFPYGWDQLSEIEKYTGEGLMWYNIKYWGKLCRNDKL